MRIKLGEVFKLSSGKSLPAKNRTVGEYNVYGGNGITGNNNEYFVSDKTIVIGRVGEYCGAAHLTTDKCWVTDNALIVTEWFIPVDLEFMVFTLRALNINRFAKTVGQPSISQGTVYDLEIDLPTIQEQEKIVKELRKIEQIIEKRNKQLLAFDNLIKARFVEMFGDIEINSKGWKKEPLQNHIDMITGYPLDSSKYADKGIKICGGLIIMPDVIKWAECKYWESIGGYEQFLLAENDIVVALDRPWISEGFKIGTIAEEDLPALLIQRTARIRGKDMNQKFILYLLKDKSFEQHCTVTGSLVPHISNKDINSYEIIVPPIGLQNEFADYVAQVDKSKLAIQKSLDETQLLFDSLMQKYFE